jgi:hypothetical protein
MAFVVNTPKGQVRLMDLPLEDLARIEAEAEVRYVEVLMAPASTAVVAQVVYRVACEHVDAVPEQLTAQRLIGDPAKNLPPVFELVDDDLPTVYEGGIPKSEDAPATTGSSGPSSGTGGPRTSSDASPSET